MLRKTTLEDLEQVVTIIEDGKNFLAKQGVNQWQHGFPNKSSVESDIKNGSSYVYLVDNEIAATAMLCSYDDDYEKYGNIWRDEKPYLTVHRFAVLSKYRKSGVATNFIEAIKSYAYKQNIKSLRIDTHKDNKVMRKFLEKNNFIFRGEILLTMISILDDKERVAYELILEK